MINYLLLRSNRVVLRYIALHMLRRLIAQHLSSVFRAEDPAEESSRADATFQMFDLEFIAPQRGTPSPRSGHFSVNDASCMYVYGGYFCDRSNTEYIYPELHRYHFLSNSWAKLPNDGDAPRLTCSQSGVLVGRKIYVFGGTGIPFGHENSDVVHEYDLDHKVWRKIQATKDLKPVGRFGQSLCYEADTHSLYVFGGTQGMVFENDLWRFDLRGEFWEKIEADNAPSPRYVLMRDLFFVAVAYICS